MPSTIATRVAALIQRLLAQAGWLQAELRRLEQAGQGHRRMRDLCELLDALESSLCWDLREDLRGLTRAGPGRGARIVEWLRGDVEALGRLVCRLDDECPGHPMVTAAMIGCGEIVACFHEIERDLDPAPARPAPGARRAEEPPARRHTLC